MTEEGVTGNRIKYYEFSSRTNYFGKNIFNDIRSTFKRFDGYFCSSNLLR